MSKSARKDIITELKGKYSTRALCEFLGVSRTILYYKPKVKEADVKRESAVIRLFESNRKAYGVEKLYHAMKREGWSISRRKVGDIMKKHNLVSKYVKYRKKSIQNLTNYDEIPNELKRQFYGKRAHEVLVSDLTYVDVSSKWHYICLLVELSHREIIGFSAGANKDSKLVEAAFRSATVDLREVDWFHTDRGGEFKNDEIEKILRSMNISRSLSRAGKPIDNAVAESMYDILKTEFVYDEKFENLRDLSSKLTAWVWWYNNVRLHGSLGYKTPIESRNSDEIGVKQQGRLKNKYKISAVNAKVDISATDIESEAPDN